MLHAQALHINHLDVLKGRLVTVETAFGEVNTSKDQELFIDHNIRPFIAPVDWTFEPCGTHYDTVNIFPIS